MVYYICLFANSIFVPYCLDMRLLICYFLSPTIVRLQHNSILLVKSDIITTHEEKIAYTIF